MSYNQNSGYGQAFLNMVASAVPAFGRIFVVVNSSDTSLEHYQRLQECFPPDVRGLVRFYTSLSDAYTAAQSNNNDVIVLDAAGTHSLSAGIAWSKNRIHVIGMDGGGRLVQQGAKVELATAATTAYVIKVTGIRNSFRNIKFIQSATAATGLTVMQEGGEGNLYQNCSFVFGVADNLDETTAHEVLAGSDSATYDNCTFGNDTLLTSAARSVFHIDQVTTNQEFKSNILKNCNFFISSSSSTATFVRLDAVGDVLFTNLFIDCNFVASVDSAGGAAIAEASQTGTSTVKGGLYYVRPSAFNVTDFATATSGRNTNQQYVAAVSSAASTEGKTPTA
jgi:hypothetical protein